MNVTWRGVFPAATTEFRADYSLDLPATGKHIDAMIRAGVHGMIVLGTVGENLDPERAVQPVQAANECHDESLPGDPVGGRRVSLGVASGPGGRIATHRRNGRR